MKLDFMERFGNKRVIGLVVLIVITICLYKVYDSQVKPASDSNRRPLVTTSLKLVSVINRHGDRAPTDNLLQGDKYMNHIEEFWPNGFSNLTDIGRMREFRVGLELRRRYREFLSFNASHYLAFSSRYARCQESIGHTLRGLFQVQWPTQDGRKFIDEYNLATSCLQPNGTSYINKSCAEKLNSTRQGLPSGSGKPNEYKNITIDLESVPSLDWRNVENCKVFQKNLPPVMKDLLASEAIANLKGILELKMKIQSAYNETIEFDSDVANQWSSIQEEIRLQKTSGSISYGNHLYKWVNELAPGYKPESGITYFDLLAQVALYYSRARVKNEAISRIELGPILTSVIQSQRRALGQTNETITKLATPTAITGKAFNLLNLYSDKKAIIYSTHDTTIQNLMDHLDMTQIDLGDFEHRFNKWRTSTDADGYLAGIKMVEFGASLVFELYETEIKERHDDDWRTVKKFAHLQAHFYNEEDIIVKPVSYRRLKFGDICKQRFKKLYGNTPEAKQALKEKFYDSSIPLEGDYSCPFMLFQNITANFMLTRNEFEQSCKQ